MPTSKKRDGYAFAKASSPVPEGIAAALDAAEKAGGPVDVADASATKVFGSDRIQGLTALLEETVGTHGDPAEPATAELLHWLDVQAKRHLVLTFGGGVNEVMRELVCMGGLGMPRTAR